MMFLILLMIVAVAAFNIVATLVMIVKEKQTDIAILRTLGAAPRNVLAMFAIQGVLIGLSARCWARAWARCWRDNLQALVAGLERLLGTQFLDAQRVLHERPAGLRRVARRGAGVRASPSCCACWRRFILRGAQRAPPPRRP